MQQRSLTTVVLVSALVSAVVTAALTLGLDVPGRGDGPANQAKAAALIPISSSPVLPGSAAQLLASVPELVNFQGVLTDGSGAPIADGNHSLTFRVYDALSGGNLQWQEKQMVTTDGGLFHALLGSVTSVTAAVFDGTPRFLEVQVESDTPLAPRQQFVSIPYAFHAATADVANSAKTATNATTADKATLANDLSCVGCVDSGDIADGTITQNDLGSGVGGPTQLLRIEFGGGNAGGPCSLTGFFEVPNTIVNFSLAQTAEVLISGHFQLQPSTTQPNSEGRIRLMADGAQVQRQIVSGPLRLALPLAFTVTLGPGAHTLKLEWCTIGGSNTFRGGGGVMNVLIF